MWINRNSQKNQSLNLIRSRVSIMTFATIIIISLIINIKVEIIRGGIIGTFFSLKNLFKID